MSGLKSPHQAMLQEFGLVDNDGINAVPGTLPLGSVIATFPNLTGAYSCATTTAADAQGFVKCNGGVISDATSPMDGQTVPNINNSKFIMGSTTAGTASGAASTTLTSAHIPQHAHAIDHDHGAANTATDGAHGHTSIGRTPDGYELYVRSDLAVGGSASAAHWVNGGGVWDAKALSTSSTHSHSFNMPAYTGSSGNYGTASPTAVPTIPPYISAVYLMRIK